MAGDRGGDVKGKTKIDMDGALGEAIEVAEASFDPGYTDGYLEKTLEAGYLSMADMKQGFCSYGVGVGAGRPKGMIGGK